MTFNKMVITKPVMNTRQSKFENHEQIQFPNGKWYDVYKGSYIYVQYGKNLPWILMPSDEI